MAEKQKLELEDRIDNERHKCNLLWVGTQGLKFQWNVARKQLSRLKKNCKEDKDEEGSCKWQREKEKKVAALKKKIDENLAEIKKRKATIAQMEEEKKALGISQLKL